MAGFNVADSESASFMKLLMRGFVIDRNPDNLDSESPEILSESGKILCFESTTGSIVRWVKIENGPRSLREHHLQAFEFRNPIWVDNPVHGSSHRSVNYKITPYYRFFLDRCKRKILELSILDSGMKPEYSSEHLDCPLLIYKEWARSYSDEFCLTCKVKNSSFLVLKWDIIEFRSEEIKI